MNPPMNEGFQIEMFPFETSCWCHLLPSDASFVGYMYICAGLVTTGKENTLNPRPQKKKVWPVRGWECVLWIDPGVGHHSKVVIPEIG